MSAPREEDVRESRPAGDEARAIERAPEMSREPEHAEEETGRDFDEDRDEDRSDYRDRDEVDARADEDDDEDDGYRAEAREAEPEPRREGRGEARGRAHHEGRAQGGREPKTQPGDEYTVLLHFDRNGRCYQAQVAEFPEVRASGNDKDSVIRELEGRLEDHLHLLKRGGKPVPEAVYSRRYPERLEVRVSQSLYRRLDLQSRAEKVGLDQLVTELLTQALDRKTEAPRQQQHQHQQHHHQRHEKGGNRHHQGGGHRHGGGGRGRGYQETMDNRENFMEYVRNLEKGNFRKK